MRVHDQKTREDKSKQPLRMLRNGGLRLGVVGDVDQNDKLLVEASLKPH